MPVTTLLTFSGMFYLLCLLNDIMPHGRSRLFYHRLVFLTSKQVPIRKRKVNQTKVRKNEI